MSLTPVRTPPKVRRTESAPLATSPAVALLVSRLADVRDGAVRADIVDGFWADTAARTPLIESAVDTVDTATVDTATAGGSDGGEVIATFLWRDADAVSVLLFANRLTDEQNLPDSLMHRVDGTDVWHLSYRMRSDWRASYAFLPHYPGDPLPWVDSDDQVAIRRALDLGLRDPLNPDTCVSHAGTVMSVVALPSAPPQRWLDARSTAPTGCVSVDHTPSGRRVWTYVPASTVRSAGEALPLLIAFDGDTWTSSQNLATTLDNLIHDGEVPPMCAVLLDAGDRSQRWADLDENGGIDQYIVDELLPWGRERLPVTTDSARVIAAGQSLGALSALWVAVRQPQAVGVVVSQSASLWQDGIFAAAAATPPVDARIYLEVGRLEWVLTGPHHAFAEQLASAGVEVKHHQYTGGHDYACWRGGIADGLRWVTRDWPR